MVAAHLCADQDRAIAQKTQESVALLRTSGDDHRTTW